MRMSAKIIISLLLFVTSVPAADEPAPAGRQQRRQVARRRLGELGRVPAGVKVLRDVEYAKVDGQSLLLDLYLPAAEGRLPVVVWIHGGGWQKGNKESCLAAFLSGQGYAVASINYRLSDKATFPAQIHDCKAAVRWLRAHAKEHHLDADHVGAWGSSAGGHLSALLGASGGVKELEGNVGGNLDFSSKVQAVADFCGPASFLPPDSEKDAAKPGEGLDSLVVKLLGGTVSENKEKAKSASPVTYVSKDDPPFLIVHGDKDNLVPVAQSRLLAADLKNAGVDADLHVIAGGGHGGVVNLKTSKLAAEFFDKHLKKKANPPANRGATAPAPARTG